MYKIFVLAAYSIIMSMMCLPGTGIAAVSDIQKEFDKIISETVSVEIKSSRLESFVKRYGVDALEILATQVSTHRKTETGELAIKVIGMIGGKPAIETLTRLITLHKDRYAQYMIFTLSDIPEPDAVKQLQQLAVSVGPDAHRIAAAVALRWRGDAEVINKLNESAKQTKNQYISQHLHMAANAIAYRLTQLPENISPQQWSTYQRNFWLGVMNTPQLRSIDASYRVVASNIAKKGELPLLFLKRFDDKEIKTAQLVAVQIMGMQKQSEEVFNFFQLAQRSTSLGKASLYALVDVSNDEAVRRLGELLGKHKLGWPSIAVEGLVKIGTLQAAEVLEQAAQTMEDKELAGYCQRAAARIRKKL